MIKHKNVDPFDPGICKTMPYTFTVPADDADYIVDNADISAASAGDYMTLANKWLPVPMSLVLLATDAAGTNLSVTVEIVGIDQFGREAKESLTDTGTAGDTHGVVVFQKVTSVKITAITNEAASDKLDLGFLASNLATLFGLPVPIVQDSASGIGGDHDTVKVVFQNGAVDITNVVIDVGKSAIKEKTAGIAAGVRVDVVLGPPYNHS